MGRYVILLRWTPALALATIVLAVLILLTGCVQKNDRAAVKRDIFGAPITVQTEVTKPVDQPDSPTAPVVPPQIGPPAPQEPWEPPQIMAQGG